MRGADSYGLQLRCVMLYDTMLHLMALGLAQFRVWLV
jgi:hypothetical protein